MKKKYILDCEQKLDFSVLAISSHAKAYKFCWNMNNALNICLEKKTDQEISSKKSFSRYSACSPEGIEYNIIENRSKSGYLIPDQKSINYFLIIKNYNWCDEKSEIIDKLKQNKEVLLVFEFDAHKNKYKDRFFLNDTQD